MVVEIIGICATVLILVGMLFKTQSVKGSILMRALNIAGSVVFVVYGALVPAISTAILNGALVVVNTWHLVALFIEKKRKREKGVNDENCVNK